MQEAIGAYVNFSQSSSTVSTAFGTTGDDDREAGTVEDVRKLVTQSGVYVVQFGKVLSQFAFRSLADHGPRDLAAGDADYNCNWMGGQVVSQEVDAPGFSSAGYT